MAKKKKKNKLGAKAIFARILAGSWEDTTNRTIRWSENTDSC